MTTLNLSIDYFGHPKTKALARLLGRGSEVLPIKVWAYAARYFAESGRLTGISAAELESELFWWGQPGAMVRAMVETRFLEMDGETIIVHDWSDHEGHIAAFKERAKKGAKARWDKARGGCDDAPSNASSNALSNAPTNLLTRRARPTNKPKNTAASGGAGNAKAGDKQPSGDHAALIAYHGELWRQVYGKGTVAYSFHPRDAKGAKLVLAACGNLDESKRAVSRYFESKDPFVRKQAGTLFYLGDHLNSFRLPESTVETKPFDLLSDYNPPTEAIDAVTAEIRRELEAAKGGVG